VRSQTEFGNEEVRASACRFLFSSPSPAADDPSIRGRQPEMRRPASDS
jgi:hypothetical protein